MTNIVKFPTKQTRKKLTFASLQSLLDKNEIKYERGMWAQ